MGRNNAGEMVNDTAPGETPSSSSCQPTNDGETKPLGPPGIDRTNRSPRRVVRRVRAMSWRCAEPRPIASRKRTVALCRVYETNIGRGQCVLNSVTDNHSRKANAIAPLTTAVAGLRTNIASVRAVGAAVGRTATAVSVAVAKRLLSGLGQPHRNHPSRPHVGAVDDRTLCTQDRLTLRSHLQYLMDNHDLLRREY